MCGWGAAMLTADLPRWYPDFLQRVVDVPLVPIVVHFVPLIAIYLSDHKMEGFVLSISDLILVLQEKNLHEKRP